jgi:hypothetical protein
MSNLKLREEQVMAVIEAERDSGSEDNPILFAESGPNRFHIMTLFFPEGDGVTIQTDLDLDEVTVKYFNDTESIELESGPLYDWAIDLYESDQGGAYA